MCLAYHLRNADNASHKEGVMTYANVLRGVVGFLEHAAAISIGFVLMVIGLGLGVTMIMLPVGVVIGLIGVALFVGGLFARLDQR
jgi:membrane-bound ClpP family serine protease